MSPDSISSTSLITPHARKLQRLESQKGGGPLIGQDDVPPPIPSSSSSSSRVEEEQPLILKRTAGTRVVQSVALESSSSEEEVTEEGKTAKLKRSVASSPTTDEQHAAKKVRITSSRIEKYSTTNRKQRTLKNPLETTETNPEEPWPTVTTTSVIEEDLFSFDDEVVNSQRQFSSSTTKTRRGSLNIEEDEVDDEDEVGEEEVGEEGEEDENENDDLYKLLLVNNEIKKIVKEFKEVKALESEGKTDEALQYYRTNVAEDDEITNIYQRSDYYPDEDSTFSDIENARRKYGSQFEVWNKYVLLVSNTMYLMGGLTFSLEHQTEQFLRAMFELHAFPTVTEFITVISNIGYSYYYTFVKRCEQYLLALKAKSKSK